MPKDDVSINEVKKAGVLLGAINLLMWPFYFADSRWGLYASLAVTGAALYGLHELGEKGRPVENMIHDGKGFFSKNKPSDSIDNAFKNIISGAETVYDDLVNNLNAKPK